MGDKKFVNWTKEESLGVMVINNPPVNALGEQVMKEIIQCLQEMAQDREIRVVIITGAGEKAFVAGADIKEFPLLLQGKPGVAGEFARRGHEMFNAVDFFPSQPSPPSTDWLWGEVVSWL